MRSVLLLWGAGGAAFAQDSGCSAPITQVERTGCAALRADAAAGGLDVARPLATVEARRPDVGTDRTPTRAHTRRDTESNWIAVRAATHAFEPTSANGDRLQQQLFDRCLEGVTLTHADDPHAYGDTS